MTDDTRARKPAAAADPKAREFLRNADPVLAQLIDARPDYPEEYRHRGLIHLQQLNHRAAKADLERFLKLEPNAPERHQVEQQLLLIERWKAGLN